MVVRHRRFLRRFSKLPPGAPISFDCAGGFHEAIEAIGDFVGAVVRGSPEEKALQPGRLDRRWPRRCDKCTYRFTESDRFQLLTGPALELADD